MQPFIPLKRNRYRKPLTLPLAKRLPIYTDYKMCPPQPINPGFFWKFWDGMVKQAVKKYFQESVLLYKNIFFFPYSKFSNKKCVNSFFLSFFFLLLFSSAVVWFDLIIFFFQTAFFFLIFLKKWQDRHEKLLLRQIMKFWTAPTDDDVEEQRTKSDCKKKIKAKFCRNVFNKLDEIGGIRESFDDPSIDTRLS